MSLDERWIAAGAAIVLGVVIGAVLAGLARRALSSPKRRSSLRSIAGPTGTFLFWLSAATGGVIAVGVTAPGTLDTVPSDVLAWLPRVLAAGLIMLAGYAAGGAISTTVAGGVQRAVGHRPASLELITRWGVLVAAAILALTNLGIDTTTLQIAVAGIILTVGLTAALLAGLGGRTVAASVAAGRALRADLDVGDQISTADLAGTIVDLRPTVVIVETERGTKLVISYSHLLERPFELTPTPGT